MRPEERGADLARSWFVEFSAAVGAGEQRDRRRPRASINHPALKVSRSGKSSLSVASLAKAGDRTRANEGPTVFHWWRSVPRPALALARRSAKPRSVETLELRACASPMSS